MVLVIMAAGMGSRFGGLKQIEPVGPNGEFIIDYSIYDAKKCGFNKVIFIIKKENYEIFENTIGNRIKNIIEVDYVFQNNDDIKNKIPERIKPLGTAHAILCCKNKIEEPFVVINSDDFYGYESFKVISDYIKENKNEKKYSMVGYNILNTLTDNGAVKRGICKIKSDNLNKIIESSIELKENKLYASILETKEEIKVSENTVVSMNMFCFYPNIFPYLEKLFDKFLKENDLEKDEYLIPNVITELIDSNEISLKVLKTEAKWYGITYKEDCDSLILAINKMIEEGKYPKNLYNKL